MGGRMASQTAYFRDLLLPLGRVVADAAVTPVGARDLTRGHDWIALQNLNLRLDLKRATKQTSQGRAKGLTRIGNPRSIAKLKT